MQKFFFALFVLLSLSALFFITFSAPSETEESAKLVYREGFYETVNQSRI